MIAYDAFPLASLLGTPNETIIDRLLRSDSVSGFSELLHNQIAAWRAQLDLLRRTVGDLATRSVRLNDAHLVLEYRIPRREKRIDAAILLEHTIVVIEFKVGATRESRESIDQLLDYALDIAYYHAASRGRRLAPVLCATGTKGIRSGPSSKNPPMEPVAICGSEGLSKVLERLIASDGSISGNAINADRWLMSAHRPVHGVVEATVRLFRDHDVDDIKSSLASDERIAATVAYVNQLICQTRATGQKVLCLLTGVPGAGKTLAGLQVAHLEEALRIGWRTVFISGNRQLLKVLRAALARDYAMRQKVALGKAKTHAESLMHSVHSHLAEARLSLEPPVERIVVFDEAQRAWDAAKMQKRADRGTPVGSTSDPQKSLPEHSEPWHILGALDRHNGGAVIVALCGNDQEIHDGDAGITEWVTARDKGFFGWQLICSPIAAELSGIDEQHPNTLVATELHLEIPVRAHRAQTHAQWVNSVLRGQPEEACQCIDSGGLPIFLTRDLDEAREWLWRTTLGTRRCGLLASSNAARLRPYGIEVSAHFRNGVDYALWFTADRTDLRSSNTLEVAATEFECQGLELDRIAVCWSWDMPVARGRPVPRKLRGGAWMQLKSERERNYAENKYRMLLTRAREAIIIWVPKGRDTDSTRSAAEADAIAAYLKLCGVQELG